jgi:hypothetical protein
MDNKTININSDAYLEARSVVRQKREAKPRNDVIV